MTNGKSRLGEKSCGVATKASKVARALCSLLGLTLCLQLAFAQQGTQQPPPMVGVLGVPVEKAAPPQVPPGSRPPDQVFPAINSWSLGALAFSPDGKQIAAAEYPVNSVKIREVATGREVREFAGQPSPQTVAMSPDGRWLVSPAPGVTVRNPANGKIVTTLTTEAADTLVFSPDGSWLAGDPGVFPSPSSSLVVWDTKT